MVRLKTLLFPVILEFALVIVLFFNCSMALLTFPRTSPTRMQLIMGIGIPVDLEIESVTIGYVFKAEYFLPENRSNYLNFIADPFDLTTRPISGFFERKRRSADQPNEPQQLLLEEAKPTEAPDKQNVSGYDTVLQQKYEKYQVPVVEVDSGPNTPSSSTPTSLSEWADDDMSEADYWNQEDKADWLNDPLRPKQPQNLGTARWIVYKGIATLAESKGLNGRACVLRSICEASHASFDYSNGILGELVHIVMTPSSTKDELNDHSDNEYLRAEDLGKHGAPCDKVFRDCSVSILDQFSGIYNPMMNIISMLGK